MTHHYFSTFRGIKAKLTNDKYYDFHLVDSCGIGQLATRLTDDCLVAYINLNEDSCVSGDTLYSNTDYVWGEAKNDGVELKNIGLVGMDNGYIHYRKDRITNEDFYEMLTGSTLTIDANDTRLILHEITGNTGDYSYGSYEIEDYGNKFVKLNGGFYQGFFKLKDSSYQILPSNLDSVWSMEILLRPMDYEEESNTLNNTHDDTDGFFLYIGTRAENKFWLLYDDEDKNQYLKNPRKEGYADFVTTDPDPFVESGYSCNYVDYGQSEPYLNEDGSNVLYSSYIGKEIPPEPEKEAPYVAAEYFHPFPGSVCPTPKWEFSDEYLVPEDNIHSDYADCNNNETSSGETPSTNCCSFPFFAWFSNYKTEPALVAPFKDKSNCSSQTPVYEKDECGCDITWDVVKEEDLYTSPDATCCDNKVDDDYPSCDNNTSGSSECECIFPFAYWNDTTFIPVVPFIATNKKKTYGKNSPVLNSCPFNELNDYWGGYVNLEEFPCNDQYVEDGYLKEDLSIDDMNPKTFNDYPLDMANIEEFTSNNKFLLFNHTPTGYTVHTYNGETAIFSGRTRNNFKENLFLLMNQTPTGYTVHTIDKYIDPKTNNYNLRSDLYYNGIGFRIKKDGSIGYRVLVQDCDAKSPVDRISVIEEYTKKGVAKQGEWNLVHIRISPLQNDSSFSNSQRTMRIEIYDNGNLVLVGKDIPVLRLKALNDIAEKQEGVPYNISIGGGTQGLCDMIVNNYYSLPQYRLPVEKYFAGTFIGDVQSFKFYNCSLNLLEIRNNLKFSNVSAR